MKDWGIATLHSSAARGFEQTWTWQPPPCIHSLPVVAGCDSLRTAAHQQSRYFGTTWRFLDEADASEVIARDAPEDRLTLSGQTSSNAEDNFAGLAGAVSPAQRSWMRRFRMSSGDVLWFRSPRQSKRSAKKPLHVRRLSHLNQSVAASAAQHCVKYFQGATRNDKFTM